MMDKMVTFCFVMILFAMCMLGIPLVAAKVTVRLLEPLTSSPVLEEGKAFRMLCKGDREVEECLFQFGQKEVDLTKDQDGPEFKYFGSGLHRGECGVEVKELGPQHQGNVTCDLRNLDGSRDTLRVDLSVDREPQVVTATTNGVTFREGESLEVTCSATGGRPDHYTYSAWIDSEELDLASNDSGDKFSRKVKPEDCGKQVFCKGQNRVLKPPKDSDKINITVTGFTPFSVEKGSVCRVEGNHIKVRVVGGADLKATWTLKDGTSLAATVLRQPTNDCTTEFGLERPTKGFGQSYQLDFGGNIVYACHVPIALKPLEQEPSCFMQFLACVGKSLN